MAKGGMTMGKFAAIVPGVSVGVVVREFIETAKTRGEGWHEYMWPKPEEMKKPEDQRISSRKASYVLRVPAQDMLVVAGVHE